MDEEFDTIPGMTRRSVLLAALGIAGTCFAQDDSKARRTIKVIGRVNKPGEFELKDGLRVFDSLGLAGGFLDFADTRNIIIIRGTERLKFNYRDYVRRKGTEGNILLVSGDVVVVNWSHEQFRRAQSDAHTSGSRLANRRAFGEKLKIARRVTLQDRTR